MAFFEAEDLLKAEDFLKVEENCQGLRSHGAPQKETQAVIQSRLVKVPALSFAHTDMPSKLSVAHSEDIPEGGPHRRVWSRVSAEDSVSDLPPNLARRKRVRDPVDDQSVLSQSDGSKTLDSQDYESDQDQEDLQNLNGNELARTFDNEVRLFILMQCEIIQLFLGCPMDTKSFTIKTTHPPQQW
jgi:hypothetical protein